MASKFQNAIIDLRNKLAVQGAETVARLKQIESDLHEKLDTAMVEVHTRLNDGFAGFEGALSQHVDQTNGALSMFLDQVLDEDREDQQWREQMERRVAQLEQRQPPAA